MTSLKENSTISIRSVANGFVVESNHDSDFGRIVGADRVFQTFAELRVFLEAHFSYRNDSVVVDSETVTQTEP